MEYTLTDYIKKLHFVLVELKKELNQLLNFGNS